MGSSGADYAAEGHDHDGTYVAVEGTITKIDGPMTQAAYDGLTPDADTLYVIVG